LVEKSRNYIVKITAVAVTLLAQYLCIWQKAFPDKRQTRREAGTQSYGSEKTLTAELPKETTQTRALREA